jgi:tight adherence protein C
MTPEQILGLVVIGIGGVIFIGLMVYFGQRESSGRDPLQERLAEYGMRDEMPKSLEELEQQLSFSDRVVRPMFKAIANIASRFTPEQQLEQTRHLLELAGQSQKTDPRTFFGTRIMLSVGMGVIGFWLFFGLTSMGAPNNILFTLLFFGLGYYLPLLQLRSQISKRQNNIIKALPDALDLLTICVEAGLGFDQAMGKVYEKWDNELAIALGRVIQEIALGKMRREALRDMAKNMEVQDVTTFTAAIIQADQLGVSIAKILRVQSDQMRVKRRQRAQEKAHQAPVKMMIPMVFLIFPSLWIVLLGPSLIILMETNVKI